MNKFNLMKWMLEVDVNKARDFYSKVIELCDCLYCENFVEACKNIHPSVIEMFTALGIDVTKTIHLSEFGEIEDGIRLYMGSYHIVGRLVEGEYCSDSEWNDKTTAKIENFTIGFNKELTFVHDEFPSPVLQLEFEARIPWVLSEKPED